jgi:hypothetical protein
LQSWAVDQQVSHTAVSMSFVQTYQHSTLTLILSLLTRSHNLRHAECSFQHHIWISRDIIQTCDNQLMHSHIQCIYFLSHSPILSLFLSAFYICKYLLRELSNIRIDMSARIINKDATEWGEYDE